jgi:aspartyl-tRNA(Asn)/glutamyl-tRNA(Gln) amidotransferase subunit C
MPPKERKKLTIEEIEAIAKLANLNLSQDEKVKFTTQLESILEYVDKINEVDTKNIEFQSQVDLKNVFRHDIAKPSLSQELAISNRKKKSRDGYYVISTVISK